MPRGKNILSRKSRMSKQLPLAENEDCGYNFGYPEPEWSLLSDVDDLEALDEFYASTTWGAFFDSPEYRDRAQTYPLCKPKR